MDGSDLLFQLPVLASLQNAIRDVVHVAYTDATTGLFNKRALTEVGQLTLPVRYGAVFLDLTRFKKINDLHGYSAGNAALSLVGGDIKAACIPERYASADGLPGTLPFRYGGDEFVIAVAATWFDLFIAEEFGRFRWDDFHPPAEPDAKTAVMPFSASIGYATPTADDGLEVIVERASRAAKLSKHNGDQPVRWTEDLPTVKSEPYRNRCTGCRTSIDLEIPAELTRPADLRCPICQMPLP